MQADSQPRIAAQKEKTPEKEQAMELEINFASDVDRLIAERGIIAALFVPGEAAGAIPNGSKIVKTNSLPGDSFDDGTPGIVIASHNAADMPGAPHPFAYFVLFDPAPDVPTLILGHRIRLAERA